MYSPDGKRILTGGGNVAKIRDATTGQALITMVGGERCFAVYSPDGQRIVTKSGAVLKIWEASSGRELQTPKGTVDPFLLLPFSDSRRIASAGYSDKTVKI